MNYCRLRTLAAIVISALASTAATAQDLTLGTTTSVRDSGLLDHLLSALEADTGIRVQAVIHGSGAVLKMAERGDVDVVVVHDPPAEEAFLAAGHGQRRLPMMFNEFVIVGPRGDPAGVAQAADAPTALRQIAGSRHPFVSRGDDSGTNKAERRLWEIAGIEPSGAWYRETGSGQGATLNMAAALNAYTLSDSATWQAFGNRQGLAQLLADAKHLRNLYSVIVLPADRHPHIPGPTVDRFVQWLTGPRGQSRIGSFRIAGERAFTPNDGF